jgi:hypothetical protein
MYQLVGQAKQATPLRGRRIHSAGSLQRCSAINSNDLHGGVSVIIDNEPYNVRISFPSLSTPFLFRPSPFL